MSYVRTNTNGCFTAQGSEAYFMCASFVHMILAGIALAVSVIFCALVSVRLCIIAVIGILSIIIISLLISPLPRRRKR